MVGTSTDLPMSADDGSGGSTVDCQKSETSSACGTIGTDDFQQIPTDFSNSNTSDDIPKSSEGTHIEVSKEAMSTDPEIKNEDEKMLDGTSNNVSERKEDHGWFWLEPLSAIKRKAQKVANILKCSIANGVPNEPWTENPEDQDNVSTRINEGEARKESIQQSKNKDLIKSDLGNDIWNRHNVKRKSEKSHVSDLMKETPIIETLEDALKCFKLIDSLKDIEMDLEKVRNGQKSIEEHESSLKKFDKEIQKLSFRYHPDKVRNRGSSDEELAAAQKLQTALNTTRTVLKVLGEAFLQDIGTEHKYGFYTNLSITCLGNEEDIKSYIHEVVFKISYLSEIKQKYIIAEIRHFLLEGQNCINCYLEDKEEEFENSRIMAMSHLKKCIKGFEKLIAEFDSVREECISEKKTNIDLQLGKMAGKSSVLLTALQDVKKFVKNIPEGRCRFYRPPYRIDDYFVLPFVCYMNAIVMCNAMFKNRQQQSLRRFLPSNTQEFIDYPEISFLNESYYLASVYSGCKLYKDVIVEKLGDRSGDREEIEKEFLKELKKVKNCLESKFRTEYYSFENTRSKLLDEYLTMFADFSRKEEEIMRGIERIAKRTQEVEEKFAKAMKDSEEESSRLKERLERSRLLREKVSASLAR